MTNALLILISFLYGASGAWLVARFGHQFGLTDRPTDRSSHKSPTPKGGGIGILVAFIVASSFLGISSWILILFTVIALLSLWGDYRHISPVLRLLFQLVIAFLVCWFNFRGSGQISALVRILPAVLFLVATANFYNFMDGVNGIAGISAVVGFGLLATYRSMCHMPWDKTFLTICIAAACAGFLPFNIPKAKVFMGDVGSVLLGFLFSSLVMFSSHGFVDILFLSAFLFTFYADEITTMFIRLRRGENLFTPHRLHLYQLLANEMGISHLKVSLIYGMVQLLVGSSLLLLGYFRADRIIVFWLFAFYCAMFCVVTAYVRSQIRLRS